MLFIYRCLINFLFPLIAVVVFLRIFFNKEDKERYKEKLFSSFFKPSRDFKKKLIWIHAASIGELKSIIPIVKNLNTQNKYEFLITSVTLSSARLIQIELYKEQNISHRFFPIDTHYLVKKFLDSWQPDLIIFVDSEIWPNFLSEIKNRKISSALINGRITKKTFNRWMILSKFAKEIFSTFDLCLASSNQSKEYLKLLNVKNPMHVGNLKLAATINTNNIDDDNSLYLSQQKIWCAASTHEGEEIFCLKTHNNLKKTYASIITIIIPRHINRSHKIKVLCDNLNLKSQIIGRGDLIEKNKEIIIINTFGDLLKYFKCSKSVFIGKSFLKKLKLVGGQNPIEAAKLGCKVYYGPYVYNFKEIYDLLDSYKISERVVDEKELSEKIMIDLKNPKSSHNEATETINNFGKQILKNSIEEINKILR